jgi:hypothetical protein
MTFLTGKQFSDWCDLMAGPAVPYKPKRRCTPGQVNYPRMTTAQWRAMRCGDDYGYGLWLQGHPWYKNMPDGPGEAHYANWLRKVDDCGHKGCIGKREKRIAQWREIGRTRVSEAVR